MADRRFLVGETVLASRDESGENHEEATVIDFYELLIGDERRPIVVVDFADGERKYMTALEPNVLAIEPEEDEEVEKGAGDDRAGPGGAADEEAGEEGEDDPGEGDDA